MASAIMSLLLLAFTLGMTVNIVRNYIRYRIAIRAVRSIAKDARERKITPEVARAQIEEIQKQS